MHLFLLSSSSLWEDTLKEAHQIKQQKSQATIMYHIEILKKLSQ